MKALQQRCLLVCAVIALASAPCRADYADVGSTNPVGLALHAEPDKDLNPDRMVDIALSNRVAAMPDIPPVMISTGSLAAQSNLGVLPETMALSAAGVAGQSVTGTVVGIPLEDNTSGRWENGIGNTGMLMQALGCLNNTFTDGLFQVSTGNLAGKCVMGTIIGIPLEDNAGERWENSIGNTGMLMQALGCLYNTFADGLFQVSTGNLAGQSNLGVIPEAIALSAAGVAGQAVTGTVVGIPLDDNSAGRWENIIGNTGMLMQALACLNNTFTDGLFQVSTGNLAAQNNLGVIPATVMLSDAALPGQCVTGTVVGIPLDDNSGERWENMIGNTGDLMRALVCLNNTFTDGVFRVSTGNLAGQSNLGVIPETMMLFATGVVAQSVTGTVVNIPLEDNAGGRWENGIGNTGMLMQALACLSNTFADGIFQVSTGNLAGQCVTGTVVRIPLEDNTGKRWENTIGSTGTMMQALACASNTFADGLFQVACRIPPWPGKEYDLVCRNPGIENMPVLEQTLLAGILEEARSAGSGLTDGMRHDLAWITLAHPFTNEAYEAIEVLVAGAQGEQERDRIDAVCRWARGYEGGRMGSNIVYYAAYRCYRLMDYDRALEYAGQCEEQDVPYKDRVAMLRALCRVGQNRTEEALQELRDVRTNYPDSAMVPQAIFFTGWIRMRDQKVQEAAAVFLELVAKYPDNSYADKARQILEGM